MNKEIVTKTIRLEKTLNDKIAKMAEESQRDFSKQIRFMLGEYIKIKENQ